MPSGQDAFNLSIFSLVIFTINNVIYLHAANSAKELTRQAAKQTVAQAVYKLNAMAAAVQFAGAHLSTKIDYQAPNAETKADEALMSLGDAGRADLLLNTPQGISLEQAVLQLEERMIRQTLERCRWHRGKAAEELGLNLRTLQRKMRRMTTASEELKGK